VIDRCAQSGEDPRLVAHLAADEPDFNAELVCRRYLDDTNGRRCRPVLAEDLEREPAELRPSALTAPPQAESLRDAFGFTYSLARVSGACREIPELRWVRQHGETPPGRPEVVSLRRVVGALERYEPARGMTAAAIARYRHDPGLSVVVLATELARLAASPITLNCLLREAVRRALGRGLTMSLIAMRCGRLKRDMRGNVSGETSWLARRLGLLPEGGGCRPTPWIHSDVLAVIARRGLGISPREVELG
jgi:hypothetical protein